MCIHYRRQVDLPVIDLFLDHRSYSAKVLLELQFKAFMVPNILRRIRWINYNGIVRLVVFYEIGVVVAGSSP